MVGLIVAPGILFGIVIWLMNSPCKLEMSIDPPSQKWLLATLAGFLVMSVVLIGLANLKMDIQDTFIQRVKFISSQALYAFWIGYGLIFGLALFGILYIIFWSLRNDGVKHLGEQKGLLRMKAPQPEKDGDQ